MIAVGCPISNREWVLPTWFKYVEEAFAAVGETPFYVFVAGDSEDNTDRVLLENLVGKSYVMSLEREDPSSGSSRHWSSDRFYHMVKLRNRLLKEVRKLEPDLFLSLDSDILITPESLSGLLEVIKSDCWAAGGKLYMTPPPSTAYASCATIKNGALVNRSFKDPAGPLKKDVIMALKLMKPEAFNVDYEWHAQGEDVGWSLAVKRAGGSLMWDGRTTSKHVMQPKWLHTVDPRLGW